MQLDSLRGRITGTGAALASSVRRPGKASDYPLFAAAIGGMLALVAAGALRRVEVTGDSMWPTLEAGDRLLVARGLPVRAGHVVVLADPRDTSRALVKRVAAVGPEGVAVEGDNPEASTDGRHFGPVPRRALRGRAYYRYEPPHRRGFLPCEPVALAAAKSSMTRERDHVDR